MSKIATGTPAGYVKRRLGGGLVLLAAPTVGAICAAHGTIAVMTLDVVIDAREQHREERRRDDLPDLEEDEAQASDEAATHARTLARNVPGVSCRAGRYATAAIGSRTSLDFG